MGKIDGFLQYERKVSRTVPPLERVQNFEEFHTSLPLKEQKLQGGRCMNCGVPFCQSGVLFGGMVSGCPLHNMIPEWNDLIWKDEWKLAMQRLISTNRFPEFTGRVCPAPCEAACTCSSHGDAVSIRENELSIIENAYKNHWIQACPPPVRTGKRVAVIGSGPSGLSAAEWLNKRGHQITVYERNDRPGGLLMYGIPNMKLDKRVILRRTHLMEEEGVEFRLGINVGRDIDAQTLTTEYDAVLLCCGASNPRDIPVPGREGAGIHFAVEYLSSITKSLLDSGFSDHAAIDAKGLNVLVIGGGDTGNDCTGSAIRQGCKSVMQLEMMPQPPKERTGSNTWPEWPRIEKTDYGQQEAIAAFGADPRRYQSTVKEFILDETGHVRKAVLSALRPEKDEATGRLKMVPTGEETAVDADLVLIAAGFTGCQSYIADAFGAALDGRGRAVTKNFATNVPKVFACGDARRGQSLVVWALREGADAAASVDRFLMGYTNL